MYVQIVAVQRSELPERDIRVKSTVNRAGSFTDYGTYFFRVCMWIYYYFYLYGSPIWSVRVHPLKTLFVPRAAWRKNMTLNDTEKRWMNNMNILLLSSAPFTKEMQQSIAFAIECIERKEREP